jgi:protein ImuA
MAEDDLLRSIPRLWRGSRMLPQSRHVLPTGIAALDRELPGGGWPMGAVVELLVETPGIGEVQLLLPAVRQLVHAGNPVLFIRPPWRINAAALPGAGIDPERLVVLDALGDRDAHWAAEQALRSPACGAVLLWQAPGSRLDDREVRRLQVAAEEGQSILFLYRAARREVSRWAALRMELLPAGEKLQVSVLRAAGTHRRPQVCLDLFPRCLDEDAPGHV